MTSRVHGMFGCSMTLFAGLALSLLAVQPAAAVTKITSCPFVISAPGQYQVANNLTSAAPGPCITIAASDVHLNLAGNTITGPTNCNTLLPVSMGIAVGMVSNVHINGGTVGGGFTEGISLAGTTSSHVNGMVVTQNCLFGIHLTNADHNDFNGVTVQLTMNPPVHCAGYRLDSSHGNVITSNTVVKNGEVPFDDAGIELSGGSNNNTILGSTVSNNVGNGIELRLSDFNVVRGNTVASNLGQGIEAGPSNRNLIQSNQVSGSTGNGIALDTSATFNTVQSNTSTGNTLFDMFDGNPNCDDNTWTSNTFGTTNMPTCVH